MANRRLLALIPWVLVSAGSPGAAAFTPPAYELSLGMSAPDTPGAFKFNQGLGVDSGSGDVYVTDKGLKRFDADGKIITGWPCGGCYGVDAHPTSHHVFVARRYDKVITEYGPDGVVVNEFGAPGTGPGQFFNPIDLAIDAVAGELYVIDGQRVQVFDLSGSYLREWGGVGTGPGQFSGSNSIYAIAFDAATATVWVADAPLNRIQAFDTTGTLLASWDNGGGGQALGQLRWARGIDVDPSGRVHVVEADNERVQMFEPNGTPIEVYQGPHDLVDGPFHPRAIAINHGNGRRYVAAGYALRVDAFDPNNALLFSWGDRVRDGAVLWEPTAVATSEPYGDVWVMDTANFLLKKFDSAGNFLLQTGGSIRVDGSIPGLFGFSDRAIAVDPQGLPWASTHNIHYPGDPYSLYLQRFDASGAPLLGWTVSYEPSSFYDEQIAGMAIDPNTGTIYMADRNVYRNRIRIHDTSGAEVGEIPGMASPMGVAVHADHLYVIQGQTMTIRKYTLDGELELELEWGEPGSGDGQFGFLEASALTTDAFGTLYVADTLNHRVQVFAPNGGFVGKWGSLGSAPGQFSLPYGVTVRRSTGEIYVSDKRNDRVQKFQLDGDADDDGHADAADDCPYAFDPLQTDSGGVGSGSAADGIGDACQCGDLDANGFVAPNDPSALRTHLADPAGTPLDASQQARCSVIGARRGCGLVDVVVSVRALAGLGPGIAPACSP